MALGNTDKNKYLYGGKELQDEVMSGKPLNLYDFEARFYDPNLGSWFTLDPLAEKYYSISPYVYCYNSPINAIDPDGRDYYWMTNEGQMILALKTMDKHDMLFTLKNGEVAEQTRVNDKAILPELSNRFQDSEGRWTSMAVTRKEGASELYNVFLFAANNSNVEWGISRFRDGSGEKIGLISQHDEGKVYFGSLWGESSDVTSAVHSHPDIVPSQEMSSMGYEKIHGKEYNNYSGSDWIKVRTGKISHASYVYFPNTGNLYNIRPEKPAYSRNIENNYKRFFFGTLK